MFQIGTALFLVSSLACGLAWSGVVLIEARVIQGVSAAIMAPTALSILTTTFEEGAERNKALGIWSAIRGRRGDAGAADRRPADRRARLAVDLLINIPVALGPLVLSPKLLRESRGQGTERIYDVGGVVTVSGALWRWSTPSWSAVVGSTAGQAIARWP